MSSARLCLEYDIQKLLFLIGVLLSKFDCDEAMFRHRLFKNEDISSMFASMFEIICIIEWKIFKLEKLGHELHWEVYQIICSINRQFDMSISKYLTGDDSLTYDKAVPFINKKVTALMSNRYLELSL